MGVDNLVNESAIKQASHLASKGLEAGKAAGEELVETLKRAGSKAEDAVERLGAKIKDEAALGKLGKKGIPTNPVDTRLKAPVPLNRQKYNFDCGPGSLLSTFKYWGIPATEEQLIKEAGTTKKDGTPPWALVDVAKRHGLKAEVIKNMTIDQVKSYLDRGIPVIIDIQAYGDHPGKYAKDWKDGHYVVASGYDDLFLYFMDPSLDKATGYMPQTELPARWHDYEVLHHKRIDFVHAGIPIEGDKPVHTIKGKHPLEHID